MTEQRRPMDAIVELVRSLEPQITIEPETTDDILRFSFWIGHFIVEIVGDQLRYAIFAGDHCLEGGCDSLAGLQSVLREEVERLNRLFAQQSANLPQSDLH